MPSITDLVDKITQNDQKKALEQKAETLTIQDSKLKRDYQALKAQYDKLSLERNKLIIALYGVDDAVIGLDLNRIITIFNKAAENLTGKTIAQVTGKPISEVIKVFNKEGEISELIFAPVDNQSLEGATFNEQKIKIQSGEKSSIVNLTSRQIKGGGNTNLGCILTLHDTTKEEDLEAMKMDFVSMTAHELRTPLTSIKGYLSVFIKENAKNFNDEQRGFLNQIDSSTSQLLLLVENLLNVSRIERGAMSISMQPTDLLAIIKQAVETFAHRAIEKHITLALQETKQQIPKIKADGMRLTEVISNLLSNAINYTPPGGEIKVWIEKDDKLVTVHVSDTGQGIPKESVGKLFSKFYRVTGKLEAHGKGTGLGLYIAKSIIDLHHGKIWVESELGKGSVFSFSLPLS